MSRLRAFAKPFLYSLVALKEKVQVGLALTRFPTLEILRPSIWRYDRLRALEIGDHVSIGPYTEIIAYSQTRRNQVPGKLIMGALRYWLAILLLHT